ncbi:MBL fold metallo-hydrolase [Sphingobacterium siyangense]|uniref:MBL fold metallo-hydrolase n=1 Tax=Sphingobacterium siyangense TaxID=459529 RepID=UPI003DA2A008
MKIYPLKDGDFSVDKNKNFTYLEDTENDKNLKMAVQPFLIETAGNLVLLDAGLGWMGNGIPKIHSNMIKAGFQPKDVKLVMLSHLHKDHIDGLVNREKNDWTLNFPNAEVYLQKREYDFALSKEGSPSFDLDVLKFIVENANIVWMDSDKGSITSEIDFEVTAYSEPYYTTIPLQSTPVIPAQNTPLWCKFLAA